MRELKIPPQILIDDFSNTNQYIWNCWSAGFENMFAYKYGENPEDVENDDQSGLLDEQNKSEVKNQFVAEILYPPSDTFDWKWYSPLSLKAYEKTETNIEYYYEKILEKWLISFVNHDKNILTLHGRAGVGKTTLLRHFFNHYLPENCSHICKNLYVIRLSIPLIALEISRMEDDLDHKIYNYLINAFAEGKRNLHDPSILIELCLSELPIENRNNDIKYFNQNPPPDAIPAQLKWLRDVGLAREITGNRRAPVSAWADFNRLAIQYLTSIGNKLIIILDNIDQLPPLQQLHAWNIIRSKLDWIKNKKNIAYIISFRSYLLENAYSLGGIQAYSDKMKVQAITPPKIYDILLRRKENYFDTKHKGQSTTLNYGNYGIIVEDPSLFIAKFIQIFLDTEVYISISKLANFNVRTAFDIAKCIFQYPHFEKHTLEAAAKYIISTREQDATNIITFPRIVDTIVRRGNKLCDIAIPMFDNLFSVCQSSHFSNSLTKVYILKILENDLKIDKLKEILLNFSHDNTIVDKAINDFLKYSIITSPQGNDLENHKIHLLSLSDSSYGELYLNHLFRNLYYMQAMAFRTYFTKEISDKFKMPHKLDQDNDSMSKRLMGALAVIDQFCKDEHEQKEWLKNNAKVEVQRLYIDYKLPMLGKTLYDQACQQIVNIKVHLKTPTVLADVDSFLKQLYNVYFQKVH